MIPVYNHFDFKMTKLMKILIVLFFISLLSQSVKTQRGVDQSLGIAFPKINCTVIQWVNMTCTWDISSYYLTL